MNGQKLAAIVLLVAGTLGLAYGGFTYTKGTEHTQIGPIDIAVKDQEHVNVPIWAGVAAIAGGAVLLVMGSKKA